MPELLTYSKFYTKEDAEDFAALMNKAGIEYITYNISFTKNNIVWQETGFDKDEKQFTAGAYNFSKQIKSLK